MQTATAGWRGTAAIAVTALLAAGTGRAAYLENVPQTVRQPDGTVLHLLATGDEHLNWLHDSRGFVIVRDPADGLLVYAVADGARLAPSRFVVGRDDPAAAGLVPGLRPDPAAALAAAAAADRLRVRSLATAGTPTFTAINNVVVFVRFADEPEFTHDRPLASYDAKFNSTDAGAVSMRNYFSAASYGQLTIRTTLYPRSADGYVTSVRDTHPRSYYMPFDATTAPDGYAGDSARQSREMELLAAAVDAISSQVDAGLDVDTNGDGEVDNICFIVSGQPTAWSTLLWPHQWSMIGHDARINGKRVSAFNLQLESMVRVGVLCHEMTHTLGAPDLYHYSSDGLTPVGRWDLMASTSDPPQQLGAYMKYRYLGWIRELPVIAASGRYEVKPLTAAATQVCFKIPSPNAAREYFVVEYRRQSDLFEGGLPGTGLLVYRVNMGANGNASGPPDNVYVYRPGGVPEADGVIRDAAMGSHVGRTAVDGATDPFAFLTYGALGGLSISEVGEPGETIAFTVNLQPACELGGFSLTGPESPVRGGTQALGWSGSSGATSYELHFGSEPDPALLATTASPGAQVDLASGSTGYWRVIAGNSCGRLASGPAWQLAADPVVPVLARGETVGGLALDAGDSWLYFRIDVPAGARSLSVVAGGGSGDADVYVRRGAFPTAARSDCTSLRAGNQESCVIAEPAPGRWYVALRPFAAFSGVTLGAGYALPPRQRLRR